MASDDVLIYDIETDSLDTDTANLKWFGCYSYKTKEYKMLPFERINEIKALLRNHKVLVGFNNAEFDNIILMNNDDDISFDYKTVIDLYKVSDLRLGIMGIKPPNKKLKTIVEFLKLDEEGKGDIDYSIFQKDEWSNDEIKEIKKYLKQDVEITKKLFDWFCKQFKPLKKYFSKKDADKFVHVKTSTASLAYRTICSIAKEKPTFRDKGEHVDIAGGHHIINRVDKIAGHICSVDIVSAYPHAFLMGNLLSPKKGGWDGGDYYNLGGEYEDKEYGKKERALRMIFNERLKAKKDKDKIKNQAYKIVINCFSEDTEVLTVKGLKPLKECNVGELVYSINQKTEKVEIKPITHMYEQEYKGDMVHFKDRNKDLMVTPNHDMLVKPSNNPKGSIRKIKAQHVNTGRYPDSKPIEGNRSISIDMKQFSNSYDCGLPDYVWDYDYRVLKCLHDGLYDGDGDKGKYRYTTASKKLRDDMIKLNLHLGHRCSYKQEKRNGKKYWRVYRTHSGKYLKSSKYIVKNPTNKIICCSVADNSTIMAGRNGNLQWTGQSFYGAVGNSVFEKVYDPVAAGDCTSMVRTWMKKMAAVLEQNGFQVIYGFTDSVMVKIPKGLTKEHLMVVVNSYVDNVIKKSVPFPQETYGFEIDKEMKFLWVITKNKYLWVNMDDTIGYRDTLFDTNTPKIVMKLFNEYITPKILKEMDVNFTEFELKNQLELLLKDNVHLAGKQYSVRSVECYDSKTSLHYQISEAYGEGKHFLIPNLARVGIGKAKGTLKRAPLRYCTYDEYKEYNLTPKDIDVSKLLEHLKPFYEGTEGDDPAQQKLFAMTEPTDFPTHSRNKIYK